MVEKRKTGVKRIGNGVGRDNLGLVGGVRNWGKDLKVNGKQPREGGFTGAKCLGQAPSCIARGETKAGGS